MRSWRSRARTILRLSMRDWAFLLEASVAVLVVRVAIIGRSFEHVLESCTRTTATSVVTSRSEVRRMATLLQTAARYHVLAPTCLVRSLALASLLSRRGVRSEVRIGVRSREGRVEGHAWVEWNGEPLLDTADALGAYEPLAAVSSRHAIVEGWSDV